MTSGNWKRVVALDPSQLKEGGGVLIATINGVVYLITPHEKKKGMFRMDHAFSIHELYDEEALVQKIRDHESGDPPHGWHAGRVEVSFVRNEIPLKIDITAPIEVARPMLYVVYFDPDAASWDSLHLTQEVAEIRVSDGPIVWAKETR